MTVEGNVNGLRSLRYTFKVFKAERLHIMYTWPRFLNGQNCPFQMNTSPKKRGLGDVKKDARLPRLSLILHSSGDKIASCPHAPLSEFCFHKDGDSVQLWVFPQWTGFVRSVVYPGTSDLIKKTKCHLFSDMSSCSLSTLDVRNQTAGILGVRQ